MKTPTVAILPTPALILVSCKPGPTLTRSSVRLASELNNIGPNRPGHTVATTYSPKSLAQLELVSDVGDVNVGTVNTEVPPGQPARIPAVHFDPALLAHTDGGDPELLINVYSGRNHPPDYPLTCTTHQGPLTPVLSTTIPIRCELIAE